MEQNTTEIFLGIERLLREIQERSQQIEKKAKGIEPFNVWFGITDNAFQTRIKVGVLKSYIARLEKIVEKEEEK